MAKYIDAESLRKEVKRLEKAAHKSALGCADSETRKFHEGKDFAYQHVGILIDSLQQEQPEPDKKEQSQIDWESEIEEYWIASGWSMTISLAKFKVIARYFIGLALNAKKEE